MRLQLSELAEELYRHGSSYFSTRFSLSQYKSSSRHFCLRYYISPLPCPAPVFLYCLFRFSALYIFLAPLIHPSRSNSILSRRPIFSPFLSGRSSTERQRACYADRKVILKIWKVLKTFLKQF